ncbi:MAG: histidine phosphatase family protein [Candidatus Omnitrophota bacterium]
MTHLIIVRHAESHFNFQNRIQGHLDSHLTPRGLLQARRLAQRLKKFHVDCAYASDLGRAYTTALEITKHLKTDIIKDPLLREINLGAWEGMTPQEVDDRHDKGYAKWLKKPSACVIPKGEPIARFRRRIATRVRQIALENAGRTVLVVTHGGAIAALLAEWLKADFDRLLLTLQMDNTSLTFADYTRQRVRLGGINDTSHLTEKERIKHTVFTSKR